MKQKNKGTSESTATQPVEIEQRELDILCTYAERYAFGRQTYAPFEVSLIISTYIKKLSSRELKVIVRDIDSANEIEIHRSDYKEYWLPLREKIVNELERRKTVEVD